MEQKINWQVCEKRGQALAEELKRQASDAERLIILRDLLRKSLRDFIKSSKVLDVYIEELLHDFVCDCERWVVMAYRLSFCVQLHKHSHSKKIWGADFVEALYAMNDRCQAHEVELLKAYA